MKIPSEVFRRRCWRPWTTLCSSRPCWSCRSGRGLNLWACRLWWQCSPSFQTHVFAISLDGEVILVGSLSGKSVHEALARLQHQPRYTKSETFWESMRFLYSGAKPLTALLVGQKTVKLSLMLSLKAESALEPLRRLAKTLLNVMLFAALQNGIK